MTNATAISRSRVWSVLTTPAAIPQTGPRLKTNLDTDLLKLIAIAAMLIDHIGGAFFPEVGVFRWIGRLAFPIFCYCLTVGLLYTHDVRKYLTRLGIFALVSQPFYILAFHPVGEFWANLTNWNIFFTLFLSLLGMYGLKERKWWLFALALFTVSWWNFDYSGTGIQLMLIFYLCRNRPRLGAALYLLSYLPALMNGWPEDPLCLTVGGLCIDWSIFAVFAAPLIFCATHSRIKINRWFFYAFYPVHLAAIAVAGNILSGIFHPSGKLLFTLGTNGVPYLLLETFCIAFLGTIVGAVISLPLSFISASNLVPKPLALVGRILIAAIRTVPAFVYGLMFIRVTGPGPFAGLLTMSLCSIGMVSKMFIESIEDLDKRILE